MRNRRLSMFVLSLAALGTVAGCTKGNAPAGAPPSTTTSASEVQILALAKEVADCIRANGLPGFPDPYFENGKLTLPPVDQNVEQQGQAILEGPCREKWQQLEAALPEQQQEARPNEEPRGPMSAEDLDKVKQWAECARQNGFPNWPDPDETGSFHLGAAGLPQGLGKGERPEDVTFRKILDACRQLEVQGMGFEN